MLIEIVILIFIFILIILVKKSNEKCKTFIDENGYYRYESNKKLIHRDVAFKYIYKNNRHEYPLKFRNYQIHHKNRNNLDNRVENLQITIREEHEKIHNINGDANYKEYWKTYWEKIPDK